MLKAFNWNMSLRNYVLYVFSFPTPFLSYIPLYLKSPGFYVHLCNSVLVPYMLPYSTFLIIYELSCYTCLTCGRILHALHVQMFHLPLTLCALMSYPRFSCVSRASLNSGSSCSTYSNASYALQFSCITSLLFLMFHLSELFSNLDYG